jgi:hypothetical protein
VEVPTFDHAGRFQEFSGGGIISWHPDIGAAFAVWGFIAEKWKDLGQERYGYPVTDELRTTFQDARFNDFRSMHLPGQQWRRPIRRASLVAHSRCVVRFVRPGTGSIESTAMENSAIQRPMKCRAIVRASGRAGSNTV